MKIGDIYRYKGEGLHYDKDYVGEWKIVDIYYLGVRRIKIIPIVRRSIVSLDIVRETFTRDFYPIKNKLMETE